MSVRETDSGAPRTETGKRLVSGSRTGRYNWVAIMQHTLAIEEEAAALERERLRARIIEHDGAGVLVATEGWPLGEWMSPERLLEDPT